MRRVFQLSSTLFLASARLYGTRYFTDSHEWVEHDGGVATIGITAHAQESLGDVVYVALPNVGDQLNAKEVFGEVESVKATSCMYSPINGVVDAVNDRVKDEPALINRSPEGDGWLIKVKCSELPQGLMTEEEYKKFID
ncbi:putative lipoic acid containing carrier protein [Trypanosoma cruzi]|uniref:Glycine cleavage system H protein n=2 Tax=Trypanosoma cruzi TaxID=5693 RepID=Q4CS26_TRYCC|nr:glycine cleavage system H protein, putative [Trypanosoma cruzi]EAN83079.1 glycine cleavage system H protein, putative [Trypanosoma cruzi]PWV22143.1 putative lipoic acid containing carrier protein [Trypanosoma cruzi]RNC49692.1 glycine cleavage system H protein [Trypanosoma cruzi]|eukprot:XP_804930.1 glycine cleavage system H protein [Trypanosoma cruzi strain CL Brener]